MNNELEAVVIQANTALLQTIAAKPVTKRPIFAGHSQGAILNPLLFNLHSLLRPAYTIQLQPPPTKH